MNFGKCILKNFKTNNLKINLEEYKIVRCFKLRRCKNQLTRKGEVIGAFGATTSLCGWSTLWNRPGVQWAYSQYSIITFVV